MSKHIYIVEDEAIVALEIKRAIIKLGYICAGMSSNYDDALEGIKKTNPHLILMDITLKYSKNGIEIARELQKTSTIPIIFLTSVTDELLMRDAIATDPVGYLVKPFRREELHSTILLGIYKSTPHKTIDNTMTSLGNGYHYDREKQLLFYEEQSIILGKKEKKLLSALVDAKGKVVSFQLLEEIIWEGNNVSESTFRTLLYRLNSKLDYKLIESIPYHGCRLPYPKS